MQYHVIDNHQIMTNLPASENAEVVEALTPAADDTTEFGKTLQALEANSEAHPAPAASSQSTASAAAQPRTAPPRHGAARSQQPAPGFLGWVLSVVRAVLVKLLGTGRR